MVDHLTRKKNENLLGRGQVFSGVHFTKMKGHFQKCWKKRLKISAEKSKFESVVFYNSEDTVPQTSAKFSKFEIQEILQTFV